MYGQTLRNFIFFLGVSMLSACGGNGGGAAPPPPPPPVNNAPVADAGADQLATAVTGAAVTLDGSGSSDSDNDTLTYSWSIVSAPQGSTASLSDAAIVNPMLTPDLEGSYVFSLLVNDGELDSVTSDSVVISTTANSAPVADAGFDKVVETGRQATLSAESSADPDLDTLNYTWTLTAVPLDSSFAPAELVTSDSAEYDFTPDVVGIYTFTVMVSDAALPSASTDEVIITALNPGASFSSADSFPLDIPDSDTVTGVSSTIAVSGMADPVSYVRVYLNIDHETGTDVDVRLESPIGTLIELSSDNSGTYTAAADVVFDDYYATGSITAGVGPGIFAPEQVLSGLNGEDANGTWILHVYDDGNSAAVGSLSGWRLVFPDALPPVADVGADAEVTRLVATDSLVTLDGSASVSNSGDPLSYRWRLSQTPDSSVVGLDATTAIFPSFFPDFPGAYVAELMVNDGATSSLPVTATVVAFTDPPTSYSSTDTPIAIPLTGSSGMISSTITVASGVTSILWVEVHLEITHTFDADLDIFLISPEGTRVELTTDNGGSGNDFIGTIFSDAATTPILGAGTASAPFTGSFRPETPLSDLIGEDVNGVWTLEVNDDAGGDIGTLNSWQLEVW